MLNVPPLRRRGTGSVYADHRCMPINGVSGAPLADRLLLLGKPAGVDLQHKGTKPGYTFRIARRRFLARRPPPAGDRTARCFSVRITARSQPGPPGGRRARWQCGRTTTPASVVLRTAALPERPGADAAPLTSSSWYPSGHPPEGMQSCAEADRVRRRIACRIQRRRSGGSRRLPGVPGRESAGLGVPRPPCTSFTRSRFEPPMEAGQNSPRRDGNP
jgi:hypothetical protein